MEKKVKTKERYIEAIGRRKTSTGRVRITKAKKSSFIVNGVDAKDYASHIIHKLGMEGWEAVRYN